MTEMNELEMELCSWQPRRPSAKLERRLFAPQPAGMVVPADSTVGLRQLPGASRPLPSFRLSWLAPAMAALLLICVLFNPHNNSPTVTGSASPGPMVAMMMSNQTLAAFLPENSQNEQNTLRNIFERTNLSRFTPGVAP